MDFFCFSTSSFFFSFYCRWFKAVGLRLWCIFCFWNCGFFFPFYCRWFKAVRFRLWWIFCISWLPASFSLLLPLLLNPLVEALMDFFCFSTCSFFFHFIDFGLRASGSGYDGFFLFFDLELLLPFYCFWFKSVGFRLWWIFFLLWFGVSFSILLPLV